MRVEYDPKSKRFLVFDEDGHLVSTWETRTQAKNAMRRHKMLSRKTVRYSR